MDTLRPANFGAVGILLQNKIVKMLLMDTLHEILVSKQRNIYNIYIPVVLCEVSGHPAGSTHNPAISSSPPKYQAFLSSD